MSIASDPGIPLRINKLLQKQEKDVCSGVIYHNNNKSCAESERI